MANNKYGTDTVELDVEVLTKPDKPEGPLDVSDITKDGCKLSWKKPKDDGGEPIEGYIVEKFDPTVGSWIPVAKSQGPATEMKVDGLTPGNDYKFRVKAVNKEGESEPLETMGSITAKDPYHEPGVPGTPEPVDWSENHVELKWTEPINDGGSPITSYIIEKKDKYSPVWEKAVEISGDKPVGLVPGLIEGNEYHFRVVAVNKAGPSRPSDQSKLFIAKPRFCKYLHKVTLSITMKKQ